MGSKFRGRRSFAGRETRWGEKPGSRPTASPGEGHKHGENKIILINLHLFSRRHFANPDGIPPGWLPDGVDFVEDTRGDVSVIDACDGVLTSATLAIAETGTIVLQDAPGQGRRAVTLLPDYHLCVVDAAGRG